MASSKPFSFVTLTEIDVPGARFVYESVEKHSNIQLMRWLECRGLPKSGNRSALLKRIHDCINAGAHTVIDVAVDNGKWYEKKKKEDENQSSQSKDTDIPLLPYAGWKKFPGNPDAIPKLFNRGHIHHHIVESVQFVNKTDVDSSADNIEDLHTAKPLKRGETYLRSNNISKMQDATKSGHYFLKAKIMASYSFIDYDVTLTLSQVSGFVRDASCTCKASAMGRCSHVAALLLALEEYISKSSSDISCTSLPCTWNKGRQKSKTPKKVQDLSYSNKKRKCEELVSFDPRAPSTVEGAEQLNESLFRNLETSNLSECMWYSLLERKYSDYDLDSSRINVIKQLRDILLENLKVPSDTEDAVLLVCDQKSDQWYVERRCRMTASECHTAISLQSGKAIANFLYRKLWKREKISTIALIYGTEHENVARQSYKANVGENVGVYETGMWVSSSNPELACSPDGIVFDPSDTEKYGLLEIKCPKILENEKISDFVHILSTKQLYQFCLEKVDNNIQLKKKHSYFHQIQMQMGITGLKFCDFVVWSAKETFITRVRYNENVWNETKEKLIKFHHSYLCPELFEMRTPRELSAVQVL